MKKIILLLALVYNFAFALTSVTYIDKDIFQNPANGYCYKMGSFVGDVYGSSPYITGTLSNYTGSSIVFIVPPKFSGNSAPFIVLKGPYVPYYGNDESYYLATQVDCSEAYAPTCTETDSTNSDCTCKSNYIKSDPNDVESDCIYDCTSLMPSVSVPLGWEYYINYYNDSVTCGSYASTFLLNEYSFTILQPDLNQPQCSFNICKVNTYVSDPCLSRDALSIPNGYIYKGTVEKELQCSQFVDGVNYFNSQTQKANSDCATDSDLYCFLLPTLDNNDVGVPPPDSNNTYPDGTIPINATNPMDLNLSNITQSPLDSVARSNALLGQLTGDFKDYYTWAKTSANGYEKALTQAGRDLLNGRNANENTNTDKIVNAINGISSTDTSGIESRLDTLIGDTSTDTSSDTSTLFDNLSIDSNGSVIPSSSDLNSTLTDSDLDSFVSSAYSGYDDKIISALLSLFDSIDYGIVDIFSIGAYSFQDIYLPDIDIYFIDLSGKKLFSADFFNSIDFSPLRYVLMLITLIFSFIFVAKRIF